MVVAAAFASLPTPRARLSAPRSHPDPRASTLRLLARVLEKFVANDFLSPPGTYAVFLDFCSLHQKDGNGERTENEGKLFGRALGNLQDLYSHPHTYILKVRPAAAPRSGPSARAGATAARGSERRPAGSRRPARLSAAPPPPPPSRR